MFYPICSNKYGVSVIKEPANWRLRSKMTPLIALKDSVEKGQGSFSKKPMNVLLNF